MDKNGRLSDKEAALIAAAKRELASAGAAITPAAARQTAAAESRPAGAAVPTARQAIPRDAMEQAPQVTATGPERVIDKAERMAQLLAAQAEEHRRRDKKLKLYLLAIPLGVLVLAFLSLLLTVLPKLR